MVEEGIIKGFVTSYKNGCDFLDFPTLIDVFDFDVVR